MATYFNGRLEAERAHSPRESSSVECCDCFEYVLDADEDYCRTCGEPLCQDCAQIVADETLCAKCFAKSQAAAIKSLQGDPEVGDLFQLPKAA
jgi:formylmethanofuran dehydrogenase subunit E